MEQNQFLKVLKLADKANSKNNDVDMLIGAEVYWNIVGGNLKRSPKTGIVAISSALGWLVNGPIADEPEKEGKSVNMAVLHVLKVQCEKKSEKMLSESITEFWRLDSIGINQKEISMDNEYMGSITFENNRYIAELPFKEGHPMLTDNFTLCKKRLKSLKERLDKIKELKL